MQRLRVVSAIRGSFQSVRSDLLVVAVTTGEFRKRRAAWRLIDTALDGHLAEAFRRAAFKGGRKERVTVPVFATFPHRSVLALGFEAAQAPTFDTVGAYRRLGADVHNHAKAAGARSVALVTDGLDITSDSHWEALIEGFVLAGYTFDRYKSKRTPVRSIRLTLVGRAVPGRDSIAHAAALSTGAMLARDLINTPPRDCAPRHLVAEARKIAKSGKLSCTVLDRRALQKLGANALLAVAQGSEEPPFLIKMTYRPRGPAKKVVALIGKGITFDSGGLSIKTGPGMETMKCDMSGAAAVLGAMQVVAALKPNVEVRAYIPTTENMINGRATRPGDVVRAVNGKTIEILNTDAEGRLILADALSLAERDGCDVMVDLATLTGACVVALGTHYAGLFTDDDRLARALTDAGDLSGERLWRLPLAPEYRELIRSQVADIKNTGGRWGGAITAALFLKEFVAKTPWAHIDLAGPAFAEGEEHHVKRGGVGFAVRTLVRFVSGAAR
jgi:leucyl aminopeptidase